jgi:hypothetical protein
LTQSREEIGACVTPYLRLLRLFPTGW